MDILDFAFDDMAIFELPTLEDVDAFCDRFRSRWDGWSDADEEVWLFVARLPEGADVAGLLREAQELLAELGLGSIRFYLDGRIYVLEAAPVDLAARSE
jgi:hypothetical protein